MANKKELVASLLALGVISAEAVEATEEDNTHSELTEMLKAAEANAKAPPAPPKLYEVCKGKAVTTLKRGMRSEGQEVTAEDFGGGAEALDALFQRKIIQ